MSATMSRMRIAINDRGAQLQVRLRDRLERAAQLRCAQHEQNVYAVSIHARENGWFDATWTTCCAELESQAAGIVRDRC